MLNLLIAIPFEIQNTIEWEKTINLFDVKDYYIYELDGINSENFDLGSIVGVVEYYKAQHNNINKIVVMSNARDLIFSWYRCFNSLIDDFIFFAEREVNNFLKYEDKNIVFYNNLCEFNGIYLEKIQGKIYLTEDIEKLRPIFYELRYFESFNNFEFFKNSRKRLQNKKYKFNGLLFCFTVENKIKNEFIIDLDCIPVGNNTKERISLLLANKYIDLKKYYLIDNDINKKYYIDIINKIDNLEQKLVNLSDEEIKQLEFLLNNQLYKNDNHDKFKILIASVLFGLTRKEKYLALQINILLVSTDLTKYNKFFAYYQCIRYIFVNNDVSNHIIQLKNQLYDQLYNDFKLFNVKDEEIKNKDRNKDLIFVFANQILTVNHAPTKIALDVCYTFAKSLNKQVYLVNLKEALTSKEWFPMRNMFIGNVMAELSQTNEISYNDKKFSYYQPKVEMPDSDEIFRIMNMIKKYKPYFVINIGNVLTGDICSSLVPTITMPMGMEEYSKSTYVINYNEKMYEEFFAKFGRKRDNIIFSEMTFELKKKMNTYSKEQLGIPKNKFIVVVIGTRLNEEIDDEFLDVLNTICKEYHGYVLFVDNYTLMEKACKFEDLKNNHKNMGYQSDLLAILEHADIYINPRRKGGGSSAVYSLFAGKPVLTLEEGDVSLLVGNDFSVKSYGDMILEIYRYVNEHDYFSEQCIKAKKRGQELTDFDKSIKRIYEQIITKIHEREKESNFDTIQ